LKEKQNSTATEYFPETDYITAMRTMAGSHDTELYTAAAVNDPKPVRLFYN
jgi:hypothetical protein